MMDISQPITAMHFTENQQGSAILEKLRCQQKEGRFCDVRFHVLDTEIPAHRNVLAASSPYFDALLKVNRGGIEHITVDYRDCTVFYILLDYIYTGKITIDSGNVEELIRLSNRFLMSNLKAYCCEFLQRNMKVDNCFMTKDIAQKTGLSSFSKTVESFIMANIMDVIQQEELLGFSDKKVLDFVSNKTLPLREELKIHVLNRWVLHSVEERQHRFYNMLNSIVWSKVNVSVVYSLLQEDSLYKNSPWCLYIMLKTLNEKRLLRDDYCPMLAELQNKYTQDNVTDVTEMAVDSNDKAEEQVQQGSNNDKSLADVKVEQGSKGGEHSEECNQDKQLNESLCVKQDSGSCLQTEDDLYESLGASDPAISAIINEDDDYSASSTDVLNISNELNDLESPTRSESADTKQPSRHKRKGIPVKIDPSPIRVRISKVKLKVEGSRMRKRGRPPKVMYKRQVAKSRSLSAQKKVKDTICGEPDAEDGNEENDQQFTSNLECDEEFRLVTPESKKNLHMQRKRGRRPKNLTKLSCNDCHFVTTSSDKLQRHRERAHKNLTVYTCCLCKYQSTWNREYYNHMKTHFQGPPFLCDFACGYSADRIQNLLYHRMSHTDERPYECTVCNMSFRSKNNLAMHSRCHTGLKPFKCDICGRAFATKGTLDQHSVTHSDLRPYLCDMCGFSTKYQSHLIAHKRIHSGDVFHCQFSNCKYSTPKRSQLACHMRTHMSIRSHICSQCGRAFVEKSHLVRHEKIHLDVKPFKCDYCDYGSTRRDKLKDHKTKYHGETSPKTPYKPRKSRRQAFDPQAFPILSSVQASADMQSLLQQSVEVREQDRQENMTLPLGDTNAGTVQSHMVEPQSPEGLHEPLFTVSASNTASANNVITDSVMPSQLSSQPAAVETTNLTALHASNIQSMLPSLLDPRVPVMLNSSQQPIMIVPQSSHDQITGLCSSGSQITNQTLTQLHTTNQPAQSVQSVVTTQQEFNNMQFMNIF